MNLMLIINTLLIIIIVHLILININNARSLLNIELMTNDEKPGLPNNINANPINIKRNIPGKSYLDPRDIPKFMKKELINDNSIKGNDDNSLEFGRLSDINKKLTNLGNINENNSTLENEMRNKSDIKPIISKESCNLGSIGEDTHLLECYNDNLQDYYKISDFKKNDRIYKELNKKEENKKNIVVYRDLLQQNDSCSYNISDDIHLLDNNQFDKYLQNKKENPINIDINNNIPCASNNNNNIDSCRSNGIDVNEKPMNGGKINNYMGYNNCYNEYALYKSI